jgi:hypothetical protein
VQADEECELGQTQLFLNNLIDNRRHHRYNKNSRYVPAKGVFMDYEVAFITLPYAYRGLLTP